MHCFSCQKGLPIFGEFFHSTCVMVSTNNCKWNRSIALIDSGAQRTIMTQKLLRELQAKRARFKKYHENGNLMQTDSPLKIVTSIITNKQIGLITNQVKIPVTEKGYIQMIIGI